jgi:hypothetical protein
VPAITPLVWKALVALWSSKMVRAQAVDLAFRASRGLASGEGNPVSRATQTRLQRRLAEALAHQVAGAKISYGTVIGGRRHFVVWLDDAPLQAFPADVEGDLASVPELQHFNPELLCDPPAAPPRLWHRAFWAPPGEPRPWDSEFWGRPG